MARLFEARKTISIEGAPFELSHSSFASRQAASAISLVSGLMAGGAAA